MALTAQDITRALGGRWHGRYGTARCPCHADKTASLKISDKPDRRSPLGTRVDVHCFAGCDWKDVKAELVRQGVIAPWRTSLQKRHAVASAAMREKRLADAAMAKALAAGAAEDEAKRVASALKLWQAAGPIGGTLGGTYLRVHRGFEFAEDRFDHALRYHAAKMMLVELMVDPKSNEPCGVQRVFLDALGRKITRKMLGRAGVCKLSPDEDVVRRLHLCEGFEDGIKILLAGYSPVWACLTSGMMKSFPVLAGIETLALVPDLDEVGKSAAAECAARWEAAGREVLINDDYL